MKKIKTRVLFEPQYFCIGFSWQRIYVNNRLILWIHPLPTLTLEIELYWGANERERFKNSRI